jgi:hypothetical protein
VKAIHNRGLRSIQNKVDVFRGGVSVASAQRALTAEENDEGGKSWL